MLAQTLFSTSVGPIQFICIPGHIVLICLWSLKLIFNGGFREINGLSKSCPISIKYTNLKKKDTIFGNPRSLELFLVGFVLKSFCHNVFYNHQVCQPRNLQFCSKWEANYQNCPCEFIIQKGSDLALQYYTSKCSHSAWRGLILMKFRYQVSFNELKTGLEHQGSMRP